MNKQTISAIAVLLITCLLGFGLNTLTDQTALERMNTIMSANSQLTSYRTEVTGTMNMGIESEQPIPDYLSNMFKMYENMKIYVLADYVIKPDDFQMKILEEIDMGGMTMEVGAYLSDNQLIVKYPIIGDYILITLEDLEQAFDFTLPETFMEDLAVIIPEIQKEMVQNMSTYFTEENVKYGDPIILNDDGIQHNLHAIEINYDGEMIINMYADIVLILLENEKGQALIQSVFESNQAQLPENFASGIEELKQLATDVKKPESETRASLNNELNGMLENLTFTATLGLSPLNIPKAMWISFDMKVPMDDMDSALMHMTYDLEYRFSKFNEIDQIDIPEIAEEDMIRVGDLIEKFGGF